MSSWKKYFKATKPLYNTSTETYNTGGGVSKGGKENPLNEAYAGHPSRIQRYYQYSEMDKDSDISSILDLIADFCTQSEDQKNNPFFINYIGEPNDTESKILGDTLKKWVKINDFNSRLWHIFRGTIMNGDQFFISDDETGEWIWVEHFAIEMVKVDETKTPVEYITKGLDINLKDKYATALTSANQYRTKYGIPINNARPTGSLSQAGSSSFSLVGDNFDHRGLKALEDKCVVNAKNMVHLSLSVGMDINWPFGKSILEPIFKTYRQKELLEDSIILYRIQRAPERRIFYIDTGSMPMPQAQAYLEQVKAQIHQRKIPSKTNVGKSVIDTAYDPLQISDDFFFAQGSEGRGSKVETLPGGDNLGEIGDLSYFAKKLMRGLSIPPGYLSIGDDSQQAVFNDGKVGTALIHEFRFNKFCMRLQSLLSPVFDAEFKKFLKNSGLNIDETLYELSFNPPQNFTEYKQLELESTRLQNYSQVADNKKIAERMKLKKYLGWTDDEILENERLWKEENPQKVKAAIGGTEAETQTGGTDLSSVGIRNSDNSDLGEFGSDEEAPEGEEGAEGAEGGEATNPTGGTGAGGGSDLTSGIPNVGAGLNSTTPTAGG